MPSCRAASILAWPAIRPPSSPTSAGVVQPHSLMLAAIAVTWASVWVRAFFRVWDQPIDRPALDPVGRPRSLISGSLARARPRDKGEVLALLRAAGGDRRALGI